MNTWNWPEDAWNEIKRLEKVIDVEKAKNNMLLSSLKRLLMVAPSEVECNNMHHPSKWRHEYDETCPAVVEYSRAIHNATIAIKSAKD